MNISELILAIRKGLSIYKPVAQRKDNPYLGNSDYRLVVTEMV
jgi:hypothetical protein